MIHALHGAVGSPHDWDFFHDLIDLPIKAVPLHQMIAKAPTLTEAGRLIAHQAAPNDILLAYSMGGRLALHALIAEPKKWQAAIIISSHPGLVHDHSTRQKSDQAWADLAESDWPHFLTTWNQQAILQPSPLRGLLQASRTDQSAVAQSFRSWSLGHQENLRPHLKKITTPILWFTGQNDPKFTTLAQEVVPTLPNAQHQIIPDAGHRLPWEQPAHFLKALHHFLQNLPSQARQSESPSA